MDHHQAVDAMMTIDEETKKLSTSSDSAETSRKRMKMNVETTQDKQMRERMQVDVDLNGQGWMAVSCNTDDGKQFVGVLLQANSVNGIPGYLNSDQLGEWMRKMAKENDSGCVITDQRTSSTTDRVTTSLDRRRMRPVRFRSTDFSIGGMGAGRFLCAKCRLPAGSSTSSSSSSSAASTKRKATLLPATSSAARIQQQKKATTSSSDGTGTQRFASPIFSFNLPKKPPSLKPIVEMKTASGGFVFHPAGAANDTAPRLIPYHDYASSYQQYGASATSTVTSPTSSSVPKIRIVMPNRSAGASSAALAGGSGPIFVKKLTSGHSSGTTPNIINNISIASRSSPSSTSSIGNNNNNTPPPIRIKIGGLNYRRITQSPQISVCMCNLIDIIMYQNARGEGTSTNWKPKPRSMPIIRRIPNESIAAAVDYMSSVTQPSKWQQPRIAPSDSEPLVETITSMAGFALEDIIWAKMKGEPYWPAKIYSLNPGSEACVLWLGSSLHGFVDLALCEPFATGFAKRYNAKRTERGYQRAVVDAIIEHSTCTSDTDYYAHKLSATAWKYLTGTRPDKKKQRKGGGAGRRTGTNRQQQQHVAHDESMSSSGGGDSTVAAFESSTEEERKQQSMLVMPAIEMFESDGEEEEEEVDEDDVAMDAVISELKQYSEMCAS